MISPVSRAVLVSCAVTMIVLVLTVHTRAADDPLPADAVQAYNKGLIAAEQEAWDLAISSFTQAQKVAERNPRILYSLGLAHVRAGHEPAGAAWLNAYLSAVPTAANAAAVRKEIVRLESGTDEDIRKIYEAAKSAAIQVPEREIRLTRLYNLCVSQVDTGYFDEFQKTRDEMCNAYSTPGKCDNIRGYFLWKNYIRYLAEVGEIQKANELTDRINEEGDWPLKYLAKMNVTAGRTRMGDCQGAGKELSSLETVLTMTKYCTIDRMAKAQSSENDISMLTVCSYLLLHLAEAYGENGQPDECRKLLTEVDQLAGKYDLGEDLRSELAAALKRDPADMNKCPDLKRMDPVREWIDLARETSDDRVAVDLKGRLLETKKETSSDRLSDGLTKIAQSLGLRMKKIRALEKKCEAASSLKS